MDLIELELVKACQSGNPEAFSGLYEAYIKKIYSFIFYKTSHQETAEDLTSLTFYKALENIAKYDSDKGTFSSWLFRIARNTVIDHYRTKKDTSELTELSGFTGRDEGMIDIETREKIEEVKKSLAKLKEEQREIIIMHVWQELSYREIAEILGKSEASCKMIFSRGLKLLKSELGTVAVLALIISLLNFK